VPAINLTRLRKQANQLSEYFDQPEIFANVLHDLLDSYADRSYRPGQSGTPPPLSPSYKVPKPVLRHIIFALTPLIESQPEQALVLCDELWQETYIEFRILTALILGLIPDDYSDQVLDRIERWGSADIEEQVLTTLMAEGLTSVRKGSSDSLIALIETWLNSSEASSMQMGFRALSPLLANSDFENLPIFYRLLTPYLRSTSSDLRPYVLEVIKTLARRSPTETAYFLRQNLEISDNQETAWMIRNSLEEFPETHQVALRNALRSTFES
jgi:hypothetical protein